MEGGKERREGEGGAAPVSRGQRRGRRAVWDSRGVAGGGDEGENGRADGRAETWRGPQVASSARLASRPERVSLTSAHGRPGKKTAPTKEIPSLPELRQTVTYEGPIIGLDVDSRICHVGRCLKWSPR